MNYKMKNTKEKKLNKFIVRPVFTLLEEGR